MKAVVAAFNQEKALVGSFSVITNLRMQFGCSSLTADAAPSTVQVSGGGLAVLDTEEERTWLRRHLVKHVASNICGCQGNCYTDCNT